MVIFVFELRYGCCVSVLWEKLESEDKGVPELGFLELTDFILLSIFVIMLLSNLKQTTISR